MLEDALPQNYQEKSAGLLAQPGTGMINDTIAAEIDARWTPPGGGPFAQPSGSSPPRIF